MENEILENESSEVETDNSIVDDEQEPVETDNSNESDNEPGSTDEDEAEAIPDKFKNEDGTLNQLELLKAYKAAETQQGKVSKELGELRKKAEIADRLQAEREEIAKNYGYESAQAMQEAQNQIKVNAQMARLEANEYAKYLSECDYPDEVRNLLMQYAENPTKELLDTIREEFSDDTKMNIAVGINEAKRQLQAQQQEAYQQEIVTNARQYLEDVAQSYGNDLQDKATFNLYSEAFKTFGTNLDTPRLMRMIKDIKQAAIQEYLNKGNDENANITDEISNIAPVNHSQNSNSSTGKSILEMSEAELRKEFRKYKDI